MRNLLLVMSLMVAVSGCANRVASTAAEKVTLYEDKSAIPEHCQPLGDVMSSACSIESIYPDEVMRLNLRENAYDDFDADAVLLQETTLSGTDVVGFGVAYKCSN